MYDGIEILKIIEDFFPVDLTYSDSKTVIQKGKFVNKKTCNEI
jgi:hypothetical protein